MTTLLTMIIFYLAAILVVAMIMLWVGEWLTGRWIDQQNKADWNYITRRLLEEKKKQR